MNCTNFYDFHFEDIITYDTDPDLLCYLVLQISPTFVIIDGNTGNNDNPKERIFNIINPCTEHGDDKYFPFTKGEGILKVLEKIGLSAKYIQDENSKQKKYSILPKFKIISYQKDENGRIRKSKMERRFKPDDIRKKIKSRFHKQLKNIINAKLKLEGSEMLFTHLPHAIIANININCNNKLLDLTYEELINKEVEKSSKIKISDKKKQFTNQEVLKYLKQESDIYKKSEFEKIGKMKYRDILNAYFISKEFEDSLIDLKCNKNENVEYIIRYINNAFNYVKLYDSNKKSKRKNKDFEETISIEE